MFWTILQIVARLFISDIATHEPFMLQEEHICQVLDKETWRTEDEIKSIIGLGWDDEDAIRRFHYIVAKLYDDGIIDYVKEEKLSSTGVISFKFRLSDS